MNVKGKIELKGDTEDVGTSGFQKRELVVTTDDQYPQSISIQFNQAKCNLLDNYNVGQNVIVDINLKGRKWTNPEGKDVYFNTIEGWRITEDANQQQQAAQPAQSAAAPTPAPAANPAPVARKLVMIATDYTYGSYQTAGWTDEQLVQAGKARWE
jgi:hypothetical protein